MLQAFPWGLLVATQANVYSGAKNVVPDDFLELKKEAAKRGRKSHQVILVIPFFVGRALVLGKPFYISAKDLFPTCYRVLHSSTVS